MRSRVAPVHMLVHESKLWTTNFLFSMKFAGIVYFHAGLTLPTSASVCYCNVALCKHATNWVTWCAGSRKLSTLIDSKSESDCK